MLTNRLKRFNLPLVPSPSSAFHIAPGNGPFHVEPQRMASAQHIIEAIDTISTGTVTIYGIA